MFAHGTLTGGAKLSGADVEIGPGTVAQVNVAPRRSPGTDSTRLGIEARLATSLGQQRALLAVEEARAVRTRTGQRQVRHAALDRHRAIVTAHAAQFREFGRHAVTPSRSSRTSARCTSAPSPSAPSRASTSSRCGTGCCRCPDFTLPHHTYTSSSSSSSVVAPARARLNQGRDAGARRAGRWSRRDSRR